MKPEKQSRLLLGVTRSKAKMYEYSVPEEHHIHITKDPARLFILTIGILGDVAALSNSEVISEDEINELRKSLLFSAQYFDSYLHSKLDKDIDSYLLLVGAASYYLCDLPGSSLVLAQRLSEDCPDMECSGLEDLLLWLLQGDNSTYFDGSEGQYGEYIDRISRQIVNYYNSGLGADSLFEIAKSLRGTAYVYGTPRQLLISDVICAVVKKRFHNSVWKSLPDYTGVTADQWSYAIKKETFIQELWPAQHLLGIHGVFNGKSAVVQMPTSAGKTRSTEIIIRSAFLSGRSSMAVVVAPFRALCHEIRNSLFDAFLNEDVDIDAPSDVFQEDFSIAELINLEARNLILVITPEKLLYMLRHAPELAGSIGLLIYDEGHQFDNGIRGITYELLLSSLKTMIPADAQSVLISAVLSNADAIGSWLNGDSGEIVIGSNLSPTYRTVAFTSWQDRLGRIEFVDQEAPDTLEYFVPRIIEQQQLELQGKETRHRVFPDKTDGKSIALYLGIKLIHNGSVAIFCGQKSTVTGICEKLVEIYERGLSDLPPVEYSTQEEVKKLHFLHERHFGLENATTKSANLGVFAHSGNTPQGIRLAIEFAMQNGQARFVVCTSTLAQGINLPIRYLIVTSVYQAGQKIKTRDFHNLIGRVGRSGMHTEGSVLFADPVVYDKRNMRKDRWRWAEVKKLLDSRNSEPCSSTLLSIFDPLHSDDKEFHIKMEPLTFVKAYIDSVEAVSNLINKISSKHADKKFTTKGLQRQIEWKINIISSIESYLIAHWDDTESGLQEEGIVELAKGTLAYYLSNEKRQTQIIALFKLLATNIGEKIKEPEKRKAFGRTLYGVQDSIDIEDWVLKNIEKLNACSDPGQLLEALWPLLFDKIQNRTFKKCDSPDVLRSLATKWINGCPFYGLLELFVAENARIIAGTQRRKFKIDHIIDMCENALSYDGTLIIGAITEVIGLIQDEESVGLINNLQTLQKMMKYGLPAPLDITLHEMGFSDRVIAMELSAVINGAYTYRPIVALRIKQNIEKVRELLNKYPSYYMNILTDVLNYI
jgi:POLQ-like helicase